MLKKWLVADPPPEEFISSHPELPLIVARLLWNRHLRTHKQIEEFLNPNYSTDLHDPYLFHDMKKAVEMIFTAISSGEKIAVHGDYDADGVCASVLIVSVLRKLGAKDVEVFIPHREEGYGLNNNTIQYLFDRQVHFIITCDCGISNTPEIKFAKELGMKVIVTDHHTVPETPPPADAIIHPLMPNEPYPDKGLCGGGVAFKLIQALLRRGCTEGKLPTGQSCEGFEKWLLDMAAISTVADMVPLVGESRTLVYFGLTVLNKTHNLGLRQLFIHAGLTEENGRLRRTCDSHTIAFQLAPRINAAGRMDHANAAFNLLLTEDEKEAGILAEKLNHSNTERQRLTEKMVSEAHKQIKDTKQENELLLFVSGDDWLPGIIGLVAGKLKEEFNKPVIAIGFADGEVVGSGRSVPGFNIVAALKDLSKHLHKFGGHPQACGFSLKSPDELEAFRKGLIAAARHQLTNVDLTPQLKIDAEIDLDEVNWKLFELLQKFEPFGMANDEPIYTARGITIVSVDPIGKDAKHLRLLVKHNSHVVRKTIAFGFGDTERHPLDWKKNLRPGDKVDLAFTVGVNEWNGTRELEMKIIDIKKSAPPII